MRIERTNSVDRQSGTQDPVVTERRKRQEDTIKPTRTEMTQGARQETQRVDRRRESHERERTTVDRSSESQAPQKSANAAEGSQLDVYA